METSIYSIFKGGQQREKAKREGIMLKGKKI